MPPTLFASTEPLPDDAPFRAPRPSRLAEPLEAPHKKAGDALAALELNTVGDLLEHLPRDRREGATVAVNGRTEARVRADGGVVRAAL